MSIGRTVPTGLLIGATAALGLAVALPALADEEPAIRKVVGVEQVITVKAVETGKEFIVNGKTTKKKPAADSTTAPGDGFRFFGDLYQGKQVVGTETVTCTAVLTGGLECTGQWNFTSGTITARKAFTAQDESNTFDLKITGATGSFTGARGTLTVKEGPDEEAVGKAGEEAQTFRFVLPSEEF
ncbi:MAG: hypothetical protein ACT4P1_15330 [Sporichthyaceae bacterium]